MTRRNDTLPTIRARHDGFTGEKRARFLAEVERSGCIRDGCRAAGISKTTVERWRSKDAEFAAALALKLDLATASLERFAFDRAVNGAEERIYREGRLVSIKVKPSDAMLRMLLQGACPQKYGRTAGERQASEALRRRLKDELRVEMRRELTGGRTHEERLADLTRKIRVLAENDRQERLDAGYREAPEDYPAEDKGTLIAPGWALVRDDDAGPNPRAAG